MDILLFVAVLAAAGALGGLIAGLLGVGGGIVIVPVLFYLLPFADVPDEHRGAAFMCAAVIATPDVRTAYAMGEVRGSLAREPRGSNGFGYDPVFVPADQPDGSRRHLAEYTDAEKNAISHRGRAFRALEPAIRQLLSAAGPTT